MPNSVEWYHNSKSLVNVVSLRGIRTKDWTRSGISVSRKHDNNNK